MRLRFTRRALSDLAEIAAYLREHDPVAAAHVRTTIMECITLAAEFPQIGRLQHTRNVRKLIVPRYPYLIYYAERDAEVVVLTIRHAARKRDFSDA